MRFLILRMIDLRTFHPLATGLPATHTIKMKRLLDGVPLRAARSLNKTIWQLHAKCPRQAWVARNEPKLDEWVEHTRPDALNAFNQEQGERFEVEVISSIIEENGGSGHAVHLDSGWAASGLRANEPLEEDAHVGLVARDAAVTAEAFKQSLGADIRVFVQPTFVAPVRAAAAPGALGAHGGGGEGFLVARPDAVVLRRVPGQRSPIFDVVEVKSVTTKRAGKKVADLAFSLAVARRSGVLYGGGSVKDGGNGGGGGGGSGGGSNDSESDDGGSQAGRALLYCVNESFRGQPGQQLFARASDDVSDAAEAAELETWESAVEAEVATRRTVGRSHMHALCLHHPCVSRLSPRLVSSLSTSPFKPTCAQADSSRGPDARSSSRLPKLRPCRALLRR